MCGIFGFLGNEQSQITSNQIEDLIKDLFHLSESRGMEASGLVMRHSKGFQMIKDAVPASHLIKSKLFQKILHENTPAGAQRLSQPLAAMGHSRMVTNGIQAHATNNQPVYKDGIVAIHNGIITNDAELWQKYPQLKREYEVDTEVLLALLHLHLHAGLSLEQAMARIFAEIEGAASTAILFEDRDELLLASNFGSLYVFEGYERERKNPSLVIFASEKYSLEVVRDKYFAERFAAHEIFQVTSEAAFAYQLNTLARRRLALRNTSAPVAAVPAVTRHAPLVLKDLTAVSASLQRCTRCVLPVTFPFLQLDEHGVCHLCRNYQGQGLLGEAALEQTLAKYRRTDGGPDCIIAFSGGRDSSYGLHLLKTKYGMNPMAFTYDWGMVTDLARRNQARMCGKLGVEHILVSANIQQKRRNIKKNIEAWVASPHLGMIPLFMAGDKQFFYYARKVRRQTGVNLVVFCAGNPYEQTGFKSGFAGVRENDHKSVITGLATFKKVQMALFYLGQFFKNPAYINSSLVDTAFAFWSVYMQPDENIYLFRYLPWDEKTIQDTLIREYNWETASDTDTTWRIGDGTASFYNYIYTTVAGFSEHDTFRSHQIRAGLITRDQALRLLVDDNEPRFETMREYALTAGFNLTEALTAIHRMPRLY